MPNVFHWRLIANTQLLPSLFPTIIAVIVTAHWRLIANNWLLHSLFPTIITIIITAHWHVNYSSSRSVADTQLMLSSSSTSLSLIVQNITLF